MFLIATRLYQALSRAVLAVSTCLPSTKKRAGYDFLSFSPRTVGLERPSLFVLQRRLLGPNQFWR